MEKSKIREITTQALIMYTRSAIGPSGRTMTYDDCLNDCINAAAATYAEYTAIWEAIDRKRAAMESWVTA